jgi:hypothetical protein
MTYRLLAAMLLAAHAFAQTPAKATPVGPNYLLPSGEFNKDLPKWLKFSGVYQGRLEGFSGGAFKNNNSDAYYLNRFRINMNVNATPWLRFSFQMQDARVFGKNTVAAPPFQDTVDLRVAYVELGDSETKRWGVRAGRQVLVFGDMRLIGHLNWMNTARSFDAVRATYRFKGTRVDAFASTVVAQVDGEFNRAIRNKADNLHGIWVNAPKLVKNMTIEPYVLWRTTRGLRTETGVLGKRDFKTYGIRFVGKVGKTNFDYNTEMNRQWGSLATDDISAWAGHWNLGYTTPKMLMKPKWMVEYNYASGDNNPTDGKRGTFDQLYPTGHDKLGFADQVGWKNAHNFQLAAQLKQGAKWTFTPRYHWLWLASAKDALYAANGTAVFRDVTGAAGKYIGTEVDLTGTYAATKQMTVSFGYAHLFPGTFLKKTTQGNGYDFPFLMVGYNF